jgi:hypothetical protein
MKKLDLSGKKFGSLTVIREACKPAGSAFSYWLCKCECGKKLSVRGVCLKHGNTTSCGCSRQVPGFNARTLLTFQGVEQSLTLWAKAQGISRSLLSVRLHRGWSVEKALTTPSARKKTK